MLREVTIIMALNPIIYLDKKSNKCLIEILSNSKLTYFTFISYSLFKSIEQSKTLVTVSNSKTDQQYVKQ